MCARSDRFTLSPPFPILSRGLEASHQDSGQRRRLRSVMQSGTLDCVPATVVQSPFGPLFLSLCVLYVGSGNVFDTKEKPSVVQAATSPTRDSSVVLEGLASPLGVEVCSFLCVSFKRARKKGDATKREHGQCLCVCVCVECVPLVEFRGDEFVHLRLANHLGLKGSLQESHGFVEPPVFSYPRDDGPIWLPSFAVRGCHSAHFPYHHLEMRAAHPLKAQYFFRPEGESWWLSARNEFPLGCA